MVKYPVDWKIIQIKDIVLDIADGPFGSNLKAVHYTNKHEARIIQLSNLGEDGWKDENVKYTTYRHAKKISRSIVPQNNVVMAKMMPAGRTIICPNNENMYVLSSDVIRIQLNDKLVNKIFFVFSTKSHFFLNQLNSEIQGSTRNRTSISKIKKNSILLPSLQEQQAIADTLSTFDTYISNLTELIEKKKAIREGALEDLVSGKTRLEGFSGEWKEVSFNDVITPKARIGWQGLKKYEYLRSGYSYLIGRTNFFDGTISTNNIWFVSKERYAMDSNIQVSENDVLVTKDGTIGKVALVPKMMKPATLNSGVFVFRTKNDLLEVFLYRILTSSIFSSFISVLSAGSTIKHLYQKDLKNFVFKMPIDPKEQQAIADTLTAMDDEIRNLETELDKMKQIREGAMDDLLTGRIRLPL